MEGGSESVGDSKDKEEGKIEEDSVKVLLQAPIIAEPQDINDGSRGSASNSDNQQPSSNHLFIRENRKGTADTFQSQNPTTKIATTSSPSVVSSESTVTDSNATLSPPQPTPLATSPSTRQSVAELIRQREAAQLQANESSKASQRFVIKRKPVLEKWGNVEDKDEKKKDDEKKPTPGRINVMNKVPWATKVWICIE